MTYKLIDLPTTTWLATITSNHTMSKDELLDRFGGVDSEGFIRFGEYIYHYDDIEVVSGSPAYCDRIWTLTRLGTLYAEAYQDADDFPIKLNDSETILAQELRKIMNLLTAEWGLDLEFLTTRVIIDNQIAIDYKPFRR